MVLISTHALREEGDEAAACWGESLLGISTHALREEGDPVCHSHHLSKQKFLPTPSARRATGVSPDRVADYAISTHALREEGDSKCAIK